MENVVLKKKQCASERKRRNKRRKLFLYSPKVINGEDRQYVFYFPLLSTMRKEGGYYTIENKMLGLIVVGRTPDEAERAFASAFDFIFKRYNELPDELLAERIQRIKNILNMTVRGIVVAP